MQKFPYYAITVRRYNVLFRHTDWLKKTQELYNEILLFYYRLYLETFPDQQPGTQEALRILETLTIVGRDQHSHSSGKELPGKRNTGTPYREIYRIRYLLQGNVS